MLKFKSLIAAAAAGLMACASQAAIVTFSFTSDPFFSTTTGTVTGRLLGLSESGSSAASSIIVDSLPAGLGVSAGDDLLTVFANDLLNSVTITGGVVTGAEILLSSSAGSTGRHFLLNYGSINSLNNIEGQRGVTNLDGFGAITFSVRPEATVPEPGTFGLLGLAMVGAYAATRRGRRAAAAAAC